MHPLYIVCLIQVGPNSYAFSLQYSCLRCVNVVSVNADVISLQQSVSFLKGGCIKNVWRIKISIMNKLVQIQAYSLGLLVKTRFLKPHLIVWRNCSIFQGLFFFLPVISFLENYLPLDMFRNLNLYSLKKEKVKKNFFNWF